MFPEVSRILKENIQEHICVGIIRHKYPFLPAGIFTFKLIHKAGNPFFVFFK